MVGAVRFELTTSCTRNTRATKLRYAPHQALEIAFTLPELQRRSFLRVLPLFAAPVSLAPVTGTLLNTWAIVTGTAIGLTVTKDISPANQQRLKTGMGVFTVYAGLSATWHGLNGSFGQVFGQLAVVAVALILGNIVGKLLRLQESANKLGRYAREQISRASQSSVRSVSNGFLTCSVLFCVGPIALLGALQDGFAGDFKILSVKSLMDGLASMAFAKTFGWGILLSAVPVVAYQGTVTLMAASLQPLLLDHALLDSIHATAGLLICCIALIILELKKVRLADYIPSLAFAPFITWLVH